VHLRPEEMKKKNKNNAPSIQLARAKRLFSPDGVAVRHGNNGPWVKAYLPRFKGADAMKVRALKSLLGASAAPTVDKSVFDRLENLRKKAYPRRLTDEIGDRPWFYATRAVGTRGPGVIVLHTRRCTDRFNGEQYGEEAEAESDSVSFIDFDILRGGPVGFKLIFCKVCRQYAQPEPPPPPLSETDDDPMIAIVLSLFTLCLSSQHA
jgi:hypothetical protein